MAGCRWRVLCVQYPEGCDWCWEGWIQGLVIHRERNDDQQGDGGVAGGIIRAERRMLARHRAAGPRSRSRHVGRLRPVTGWHWALVRDTVSMQLLEREASLASLADYAREARRGEGRLVLVAGEAGVGKSALVERLHDDLA